MGVLLISVQRDLDILGLKYLHHYLLENGQPSRLLFMPTVGRDGDRLYAGLERFVAEMRPSLIAFSLMSIEFAAAAAATRFVRGRFPGVPVVWGGIHPTSDPESCLEVVNHICVGEGEKTLLDLARAAEAGLPFDDIPNMGRRVDGLYRQNAPYPLLENLDELPLLRRISPESYLALPGGVVPLSEKHFRRHTRFAGRFQVAISSRGCPFGCTYCCNSQFRRLYKNWNVRRRGVEHLIAELELALADFPGIDYFNFHDDCFLACSMEYLREFCAAYKARIGRPLIARSAPTYITDERLGLLKDAGLAWINLGLQSGSERVCQDIYSRRALPSHFLEAARLVHKHRIAPFYDVILDNPWETEQDQLDTVRTLMETPKPFYPEMFSLVFYTGTALHEKAVRECPEQIEDPTVKDFHIRHKRPINDLVEVAVTLHRPLMRSLLGLYERAPSSWRTRMLILAAKCYCRAVLAPVSYLRVIHLSQNGSWTGTLRVLRGFVRRGLYHYLNLFRGD